MAARLWSATFPGELPGTCVTVSMAEDSGNVHESVCAIEVIGVATSRPGGMAHVSRVPLTVGELRALVATVGGWPGVARG